MSSESLWQRCQVAVLRRFGRRIAKLGGRPEAEESAKLGLLGEAFWEDIRGRSILDFGCGQGREAVQMACGGALRVIGLDIQEHWLAAARTRAEAAGVGSKCSFVSRTDERVDRIVSLDAFEHFGDPSAVLKEMGRLLTPEGSIWIAFGPVWRHPRGGHLFSVFPWAHLLFQERALLAWRSEFKHDGAQRFGEVAGGLNQMTIRRFCDLVGRSGFRFAMYEEKPIHVLRWLHNRMTREYSTSLVTCRLVRI